jgi:epoxyqueuosine reductase
MKEAIRRQARELGFDECRFTSAAPPDSAARFQRWLDQGSHGQMDYLERHAAKRLDPQKVLAGARTVIVLAAAYGTVTASTETGGAAKPPPACGVVARYARHADYHDVLAGPLRRLSEFVNQLGGPAARSLWYVDTGPVLERDFAQRAGLGFIGKHTNLISRRLGNWLFLCEIITTLELEPDAPERNHCGSCTRCLAACPTAAITAPFQLNARRCISYLTIELKGPIPLELRSAIGNRIYGCDDCLAVCPWNRFAHDGRLMRAHQRPDLSAPALLELLGLDETEFRGRFAGTPILRAKRRGLVRNVCVALGNIGDPAALPALAKAAQDPEPLVAEHARWAINQIHARAGPSAWPGPQ